MALVFADRVRETSNTTGVGTLTLAGAVTGFQTFSSALGNGNTTYYVISSIGSNQWEVGIGTIGAGTLSRDTVLASSIGAGLFTSFGAGSKDVYCSIPAAKIVELNANDQIPFLTHTTANSLTAAGVDQSTALVLSNDFNIITTTGVGTGVKLPTANPGRSTWVVNRGANGLTVYPGSGVAIDGLATNIGYVMGNNTGAVEFKCITTTLWYTVSAIVRIYNAAGTLLN